MEIGTIIKKYRRERDMTQEQLAEYLRVSVSAVSQWESGKTAPDLSAIPAICNLFGISADELLGIDREHKQEKIDEIVENASRYSDRGYMTEAEKVLEEGLREYPDSYDLMESLMNVKFYQNNWDEVIRLGNRILEGCTEDRIRDSAKQTICFAYQNKGDFDKAREIARKLPSMIVSKEVLLAGLPGSAGHDAHLHLINFLIQLFDQELRANRKLDDGTRAYTEDEMAVLHHKRLAFFELLFEDGNYVFYHTVLKDIHLELAQYYAGKQNTENTLHHLSCAADHAIAFTRSEGIGDYTCLLLRGDGSAHFSTNNTENSAKQELDHLSSPIFDFLRDTPEFAAILAKLEPVAGDWKVRE
ncbi:MAG: helix-turn-helix transcriptional regulator [Ruminococcaceae bacterium]|nr:helix-turn-helix transcriptional regulator [Oscillospiraceae bacterium]